MYDALKALGVQEDIRSRENPLGLIPYDDNDNKIDSPEQEPSELETKAKTGFLNSIKNAAKKAVIATAAAAILFYSTLSPTEYRVEGQTRRFGHYEVKEVLEVKNPQNLLENLIPESNTPEKDQFYN